MEEYSQETIEKGEIFRCLIKHKSDNAINFLKFSVISEELSRYIAKEIELNPYVLMRCFENFDKECLLKYQTLDENIINSHLSEFSDHYDLLAETQILSEDIIEKIIQSYTDNNESLPERLKIAISGRQQLSNEFIGKYFKNLNWKVLTAAKEMDDQFLWIYNGWVDWKIASMTQKIPENLIDEHNDKLDWLAVSQYQELTEAQIYNNYWKLNIPIAIKYQKNFTAEIVRIFKPYVPWELVPIYVQIPSDIWEKNYYSMIRWDLLCQYQVLTEDFMHSNSENLKWDLISQYQTLSEDFIRKYEDKVDWKKIGEYQTLSDSFKEEFADRLGTKS